MVYGGFLTLTHSHLDSHFPTMVGFCHGGNMLGNQDDNDEDDDVVVELLMMMYGNAHCALLHWI